MWVGVVMCVDRGGNVTSIPTVTFGSLQWWWCPDATPPAPPPHYMVAMVAVTLAVSGLWFMAGVVAMTTITFIALKMVTCMYAPVTSVLILPLHPPLCCGLL